jgi:hypothetical protein
MYHYTAIKLNVPHIFTDIDKSVSINPIKLVIVLKTKLFYSNLSNIDIFNSDLIIYD